MAGILRPSSELLSSDKEGKFIIHNYVLTDSAENLFNGSLTLVAPSPYSGTGERTDRPFASWASGRWLDIEFLDDVKIWDIGNNAYASEVTALSIYENNENEFASNSNSVSKLNKIGELKKYSKTYPNWDMVAELPKGRYIIIQELTGAGRVSNEWYLESTSAINKTLILHDGEYKKWNPTFKLDSKENAIPNMTSNNTPSGLVESSTIFSSGYEPYRAFNDIVNKDSNDTWAIQGSSGWISYTFPNPICIGSYKITGHGSANAVNPKDWKLEGSNNGVDWVVLDTRTNVTNWLPTTTRSLTFEFENKEKFKTYKLTILANNGDTSTQITKLEMFEFAFNDANNWSTHQLSEVQTEGMDSLSPLLDRKLTTLEPIPLVNETSVLLSDGEEGKIFSQTINLKKYLDIRNMKVEVK